LDSLIRRLTGHRLAQVRAQAVESVDVLESLDEMLLKSGDGLEGGDIELLIIGTMGALHVGVILPLPLPDAQELDSEEIKGSFLQPSQLSQALPSELLSPICLSLQDPRRRRRVDE